MTWEQKTLDSFKNEIGRAAAMLQDSIPGAVVTLVIRFPVDEHAYVIAGEDSLNNLSRVLDLARQQTAQ